jgi:hypothetical protein
MRSLRQNDLTELFAEFETLRRKYEQMVADYSSKVVSAGKSKDFKAALRYSSQVAVYRERLGYCVGVLAMIRWLSGGRQPRLNPTRHR